MIYRELYIPKYDWLVQVFYHVTCFWTDEILDCLRNIGCPPDKLEEAYQNLTACKLNTGLTYSNYHFRESVMVIGKTSSYREFVNSLFHESRHLTDHISVALELEVGGEPIAYLAGDIGASIADEIKLFICDCRCHKDEINHIIHKQQKLKRNGNKSRFKDRGCPTCNRSR